MLIGSLMLALAACGLLPQEEVMLAPPLIVPEEITYQTVLPRKGLVEDIIAGTGYFTPVKVENYKFESAGGIFDGFSVKAGDLVKKGDLLASLRTKDLSKAIERKKLEVDSLLAALDLKKATNEMNLEKAREDLKVLQALEANQYEINKQQLVIDGLILEASYAIRMDENTYQLARMELEDLMNQSKESDLVADFDGVVTFVADMKAGDSVPSYTTMVTLADPTEMQVQYQGTMASRFAINMPVEIMTGGEAFMGKVVFIPGMAPKEQAEIYKNVVRFALDTYPASLVTGQSAQFKVQLAVAEDTIVVTRKALKKLGGKDVIYTLEDGIRVENYVKIGVEGTGEVEILSGIDLGDVMIME